MSEEGRDRAGTVEHGLIRWACVASLVFVLIRFLIFELHEVQALLKVLFP